MPKPYLMLFKTCKISAFNKADLEAYRKAKQEFRKLAKFKKRQANKKNLDKLATTKDSREFWNAIRESRAWKPQDNPIIMESWELFYSTNLAPKVPDDT